MGGWLYELKIRLNSAFNSVEIEVEVEAELGNYKMLIKIFEYYLLTFFLTNKKLKSLRST